MANELTMHCSLRANKGSLDIRSQSNGVFFGTMTGGDAVYMTLSMPAVAANEVAIDKGSLSTIGRLWARNNGATDTIELLVGTGGACFALIPPGEEILTYLGSAITAPYASSTGTEAPQLEYLLCEV